jgi:hypothetical protein
LQALILVDEIGRDGVAAPPAIIQDMGRPLQHGLTT